MLKLLLPIIWLWPLFAYCSNSSHGDAQVRQLLRDRPELRFYVKEGNPIWDWIVKAFEDPNNGFQIVWDSSSTSASNPFAGECSFTYDPDVCRIRIDETYKTGNFIGINREPEEMLFSIIFELCNARRQNDSPEKALAPAYAGKLSKHDFIIIIAKNEYLAERDAQSFYIYTLDPYCRSHHVPLNEDLGVWPSIPDTFDEWMQNYPVGSYYPWKLYGNQYDALVQLRR